LASLTVGVGAAAILAGMGMFLDIFGSDLPLLFLIVGALVATVDLVALGIVTIAAGVLPWWCGAALIASPSFRR
jgi:Zn-dependent membrane protease YugP